MSGKDIARAFRTASRNAGEKATAAGHSVTFKRGRNIIVRAADGGEKVVHTLEKAFVRAETGTLRAL
jgi:hypothetical protein